MSRIGKALINIPQGVEITAKDGLITVKGKLGTLTQDYDPSFSIEINDGILEVKRPSESKPHKALHGLYRALIQNMVVGVSEGYKRSLELVGVGYRAASQGQSLDLSLGYSHNIVVALPKEIKVEAEMAKGKNPVIHLSSHDKQLLGMAAAKIRSLRKPEPYKGKGVRYVGEQIRRKAGKTAGK
ncbi:MAG: 50S ribosomal protein L6 [Cryomorphaceae bacterium]|jgi:large subunit ribosomal protein L6|nr:50S ribosomal protein L6 [Cryomorphaceae bacterium]